MLAMRHPALCSSGMQGSLRRCVTAQRLASSRQQPTQQHDDEQHPGGPDVHSRAQVPLPVGVAVLQLLWRHVDRRPAKVEHQMFDSPMRASCIGGQPVLHDRRRRLHGTQQAWHALWFSISIRCWRCRSTGRGNVNGLRHTRCG